MPQWQLDLRYPLKCPNECFLGVFSEHVLEHLYIDESLNLLKEIHRILKPNGTLRLSVPSLEFRVQCYLDAKKDQASTPLATEHIRKLTQEFLHLSVWDFDRLYYALQEIGFRDIQKSSFGRGRDSKLIFDLEDRAYESLYIEANK